VDGRETKPYRATGKSVRKSEGTRKAAKPENGSAQKAESPPLDATNTTQPLNEAIYQKEMLIGKLERDIAALEEKIQQRLNAHGLRLSDMENFAYQIESSKVAWLELQQTKQEISKAFDAAVVKMNNTP